MNLSEFFFFKTQECEKRNKHDFENCYNFHPNQNDFRRVPIDFSRFLLSGKLYDQSDELISKNILLYYSNEIGFENENMNKKIFSNFPCKNATEHKFHVLNYKNETCVFESFHLDCPYTFC